MKPPGRFSWPRVLRAVASVAVIAIVFFYLLPGLVDYREVVRVLGAMTWFELVTLVGLGLWNLATYWFVEMAACRDLNVWQAMKITQASTTVSNALPAGAALGVGVQSAMYASYGYSKPDIALALMLTGTWNTLVKLGMPVIALALLAISGDASGPLVAASFFGAGFIAVVVLVFGMILKSDRGARTVARVIATPANLLLRVIRRGSIENWAESVTEFRGRATRMITERWIRLSLAVLVSHATLYLVLLLALRHIGVAEAELTWIEVLAAFAFVRLLTAIPITPGGLGVVELGLVATLVGAGGPEAEVVAAVLIFRVLTYVLPIPLGLVSYLLWRRNVAVRRLRMAI